MPKLLLRIVGLFLVPCLLADPVMASAFSSLPATTSNTRSMAHERFNEQALSALARMFPRPSTPNQKPSAELDQMVSAASPPVNTPNGVAGQQRSLKGFFREYRSAILAGLALACADNIGRFFAVRLIYPTLPFGFAPFFGPFGIGHGPHENIVVDLVYRMMFILGCLIGIWVSDVNLGKHAEPGGHSDETGSWREVVLSILSSPRSRVGAGLVIGGAISNMLNLLIDPNRVNWISIFFNWLWYSPGMHPWIAIFNLADMGVAVGALLAISDSLRSPQKPQSSALPTTVTKPAAAPATGPSTPSPAEKPPTHGLGAARTAPARGAVRAAPTPRGCRGAS